MHRLAVMTFGTSSILLNSLHCLHMQPQVMMYYKIPSICSTSLHSAFKKELCEQNHYVYLFAICSYVVPTIHVKVAEWKLKCEAIEKREAERREADAKKHKEEVAFLENHGKPCMSLFHNNFLT